MPRQFPTLAGLCPLHDFNLKLVGIDQVEAGYAETTAGHLLDGRAATVAVGIRDKAVGVFSAFARVGLAADTVHGNGKGLVGLLRNGTVGHGPGLEALGDFGGGLHFLDGNGLALVHIEFHQAAQSEGFARLVVDDVGIFLEDGEVPEASGLLEFVYGYGIEEVAFTIDPPLVDTAGVEGRSLLVGSGGKGVVMANPSLHGDGVHADALDSGSGVGEVFVDHLVV